MQRGSNPGQRRGGNDGGLEEGAGAAAVGLSLHQQHAFAVPDLTDGVVDLQWPRRGPAAAEVLLEVGVVELRPGVRGEAEADAGYDVAAAVGGVEAAAAVAEVAVGGGERDKLERVEVEHAHLGDGLGDLLPIGADVLHRGSADQSGDTGEALDARDSLLADGADKAVPVVARGNRVLDGVGA